MTTKHELRQHYLEKRKNLSDLEVHEKSLKIVHELMISQVIPLSLKKIALYAPIHKEVETFSLYQSLLSRGVQTYFPRLFKSRDIEFALATTWEDLVLTSKGFLEPSSMKKVEPLPSIEAIIVPGIVFDHSGFRIGYGLGCYDKALKGYQGLKIGLAYDFQVVSSVPHEESDVAMDWVVTEEKIIQKTEGRIL